MVRTKIDDVRRDRSHSKRAKGGNNKPPTIMIEKDKFCSHCGHEKVFTYIGSNSANFNKSKCSRCKKWLSAL